LKAEPPFLDQAVQARGQQEGDELHRHAANHRIAIGCITSEPRPCVRKIGSRPNTVVAVVISRGRTRFNAASMTSNRTSSTLCGTRSLKLSSRKVTRTTLQSSATPNRAMKPTQTATLMLAP
jgi:hypothetical protein